MLVSIIVVGIVEIASLSLFSTVQSSYVTLALSRLAEITVLIEITISFSVVIFVGTGNFVGSSTIVGGISAMI